MNGILTDDDRRRLLRNLALSTQTVISCGHAMRVTVADMLGEFENLREITIANPEIMHLVEKLEEAIEKDLIATHQVCGILGLKIRTGS